MSQCKRTSLMFSYHYQVGNIIYRVVHSYCLVVGVVLILLKVASL